MIVAILKLNSMPVRCIACSLSTKKNDGKWYCTAYDMKYEIDIDLGVRMGFCPLIEVEEDWN